MAEKTITFKVGNEVHARLLRLKDGMECTWKEFFVLCAIGYCKRGIELGGRDGPAYKRDIIAFQHELNK